eukprot:6205805-Pleurochrysis_carterae.AAC.2
MASTSTRRQRTMKTRHICGMACRMQLTSTRMPRTRLSARSGRSSRKRRRTCAADKARGVLSAGLEGRLAACTRSATGGMQLSEAVTIDKDSGAARRLLCCAVCACSRAGRIKSALAASILRSLP